MRRHRLSLRKSSFTRFTHLIYTERIVWNTRFKYVYRLSRCLANGLPIDHLNPRHFSLLDFAVIRGRPSLVYYLIESGIDVNPNDGYPLRMATHHRQMEILEALLVSGARAGITLCLHASNSKKVKALLKSYRL